MRRVFLPLCSAKKGEKMFEWRGRDGVQSMVPKKAFHSSKRSYEWKKCTGKRDCHGEDTTNVDHSMVHSSSPPTTEPNVELDTVSSECTPGL